MPQYDANGKRLSGAALVRHQVERRLQAAGIESSKSAGTADPAGREHFARLAAPPVRLGVDSCEAWANGLALLSASCAEKQIDPTRNRLLRKVVAKLGRMKARARVSTLACERRWREESSDEEDLHGWLDSLLSEDPPIDDPIAGAAWAFFRLCQVGFQIARSEAIDEGRWLPVIDALGNVVAVECQRLQRIKKQPARPGTVAR